MAHVRSEAFLQWALPRMGLTWSGFRRVRRQVVKRIGRRLAEIRLPGLDGYRNFLETHPAEWETLESFCHITISRFFRDAAVFETLGREILPRLAEKAASRGYELLRVWSAGCASGEEPYSLDLLWRFALAPRFPGLALVVVATDADERVLARARAACYPAASFRELPAAFRDAAFRRDGRLFCLRPEFRDGVGFFAQDLRREAPAGPFDLVLCRNLAFTYFDAAGQTQALDRIRAVLAEGGALAIGRKERLPEGAPGFAPWIAARGIYRKTGTSSVPANAAPASRRMSSARPV
ncbi:MAG: hypothetical protein IT564_07830 [Rhodospirillales bacterium]|nr:hypothetical protein [Rhodospirillales bacterium]